MKTASGDIVGSSEDREAAHPAAPRTETIRVLSVEDNSGDAVLLSELLKDSGIGYTLVRTATLSEARAKLDAALFDVIFLDLSLPDAQGVETVKQTRAAAADTPIIVLTGLMDEAVGVQCVQTGAQDYLVKGQFDGALLKRVLRYSIERKHLEKIVVQSEKLAAMGRLAAGVAHDINNPVAVILGFADSLIRRAAANDALRLPYESIHREALRCKQLVQNLLTFSRNDKVEFKSEALSEAIEGALVLIETLAKTRHVQIVRNYQDALPRVQIDRHQIQQVVINLCTNAMDAMPKGGTVTVGIASHHADVELSVSDSGTGVPLEIRERIFEAFFTTKEVGKGTGLGLALIAEIAKNHKAVIDLKTETGQGSIFTIRLPAIPLGDFSQSQVTP